MYVTSLSYDCNDHKTLVMLKLVSNNATMGSKLLLQDLPNFVYCETWKIHAAIFSNLKHSNRTVTGNILIWWLITIYLFYLSSSASLFSRIFFSSSWLPEDPSRNCRRPSSAIWCLWLLTTFILWFRTLLSLSCWMFSNSRTISNTVPSSRAVASSSNNVSVSCSCLENNNLSVQTWLCYLNIRRNAFS